MFEQYRKASRLPALPEGRRLYVIGDIHGEAELLADLLGQIEADIRKRTPMQTTLVILGDFIDRGHRSVDLLYALYRCRRRNLVVLKGNHEAALVDVYRGDDEAFSFWLRFGGQATLRGLGIDVAEDGFVDSAATLAQLRDSLDERVVDWLDNLPHSWDLGDYYFCHAGVRPGVDLMQQDQDDLLWIREPFLSSKRDHGKVVVHGHSLEDATVLRRNRIGIDTGAHEHGRLTALGLEGQEKWFHQAVHEPAGETTIKTTPEWALA